MLFSKKEYETSQLTLSVFCPSVTSTETVREGLFSRERTTVVLNSPLSAFKLNLSKNTY